MLRCTNVVLPCLHSVIAGATDHGAHCQLVPDHKTGWRLLSLHEADDDDYQLDEDDGD